MLCGGKRRVGLAGPLRAVWSTHALRHVGLATVRCCLNLPAACALASAASRRAVGADVCACGHGQRRWRQYQGSARSSPVRAAFRSLRSLPSATVAGDYGERKGNGDPQQDPDGKAPQDRQPACLWASALDTRVGHRDRFDCADWRRRRHAAKSRRVSRARDLISHHISCP